jgi:hypothetical protein
MSDERRDNIEVRLHKDGTLDEVVIYDPHTGHGIFHLEQMSDQHFWMRAYGVTQDLVVNIGAISGTCEGRPICDERGFITGYENYEGPKIDANYQWDDSTMESECHPDSRTPEAERHDKIAEIINRYGVACVLQDIAAVVRKGRMAEHEQEVVADLDNARTKFLAGDKAYWDARIAEDYGKEE